MKRLPLVASHRELYIPGGTIKLAFAVFSGEDFAQKRQGLTKSMRSKGLSSVKLINRIQNYEGLDRGRQKEREKRKATSTKQNKTQILILTYKKAKK